MSLSLITPSLKLDTDPRVVYLFFDKEFDELFSVLSQITTAEIAGLN
jgi:hypothetical protein